MNWSGIGRWGLFVGSLAIGVLAGLGGFWIFELKVPAALQTSVMALEARIYFVVGGVILGIAIFLWTLVGASIAGRAAASKARRDAAGAAKQSATPEPPPSR